MTRLFTAGMLMSWVTSTGTHAFARGAPAGSPPNAVQRCLALNLDAATVIGCLMHPVERSLVATTGRRRRHVAHPTHADLGGDAIRDECLR
jgi:hypothetical protein